MIEFAFSFHPFYLLRKKNPSVFRESVQLEYVVTRENNKRSNNDSLT